MTHEMQFYIDGAWVDPAVPGAIEVIDPATEESFASVAAGSAADIDLAVAAARVAFPAYARTSRAERLALLRRFLAAYTARRGEVAHTISREMGAPITLAVEMQSFSAIRHFTKMAEVLETFPFEELRGTTLIAREPVGVCGLITPWNWPITQISCKVAAALAAGCTMVLKPSEIAPLNAILFTEALHEAGVPHGVFNLVNGTGPVVGEAISAHPDIDMVSFTGSTRAGIRVAKAAADTVKRVHQELGGKSANILLPDVDLEKAVTTGVVNVFRNSGQSCNAPTRMFVPANRQDEAAEIARRACAAMRVGPSTDPTTDIGPVVSAAQFERVQRYIELGIAEGAQLVAGGPGRPAGINRGYYVKPTVFAHVRPDMTVAREEIFGPVVSILPYHSEEEVIELANDSVYGLAAFVQSGDVAAARRVAMRMRAGNVQVNYPAFDAGAPFGGYKQSGNGREYGEFGLAEFLELKAVVGYAAA
jgi:aldehyde dehydrogenase (NAD+)